MAGDEASRARRRAAPSSISAIPAALTGSTEKPNSPRTRQIAPSAPGRSRPGCNISKPSRPSAPSESRIVMMFGSITASRIRVQSQVHVLDLRAGEVELEALRHGLVALELFSSAGSVGATASITFVFSASSAVRFDALRTAASAHCTLRPWLFASARSDAAASFTTLRRRSVLDVLAADADRRRRADVRLRRHREDVGGLPIHTPADAARAPFGRDVDDDRDLRRELPLVDLPHRVREPAGRVEHDHDRVVAVVVRAVDLLDQVVRRDRVHVVLEVHREHAWLVAAPRRRQAARQRRLPRQEARARAALFTAVRILFGRGSSTLSAKPISGTVATLARRMKTHSPRLSLSRPSRSLPPRRART